MKRKEQFNTSMDLPDSPLDYQSRSVTFGSELNIQMEIDRLAIENHIGSSRLADSQIKSLITAANQSMMIVDPNRNNSVDDVDELIVAAAATDADEYAPRQHRLVSDYNIVKNSSLFTIPNNLKLSNNKQDVLAGGAIHGSGGVSLRNNKQMQLQLARRPVLPDYMLDFGYVILGSVKTHVIRASNMSRLLASFDIERQNYDKTGFIVDLERVKNLPNEESVELSVTFDPRGANLSLGPVHHLIPLNVTTINLTSFYDDPFFLYETIISMTNYCF